jgi:NADH:ubiquinone oxidoreductase subunit F (NADH-binding)
MSATTAVPQRPPAAGALPRLLAADPGSVYGPLAEAAGVRIAPAALIRLVGRAGLLGRGGAAFPVDRKLSAVAEAGRRQAPVVVGNGAEGEPASAKDRTLLRMAPQLVLDGLELAGRAVGAERLCLAVAADSPVTAELRAAAAARARSGAAVEIAEVPARFLSGQSSALAAALDGAPPARALPWHQDPPVRESGVAGAPTLVQNVETLAHLALIARFGPDWFRAVGTEGEPGSMLCTVTGPDGRMRVLEAAAGVPLRALFGSEEGGGTAAGVCVDAEPVQAVLVGGYHGSWLPAGQAFRARLGTRELGVPLGAGVLAALPTASCGLAETARVLRYLALESAGQCGPCLNGLPRIAAGFTELAEPRRAAYAPGLLDGLYRWSGLVTGRGACHHPDGTARFAASALSVFAEEVRAHARGRCTGRPGRGWTLPVRTDRGGG